MPTTNPAEYTPNWNDPTETRWFEDPDEVVAFARWYYEGSRTHWREVVDLFEKPWKWEPEYRGYVAERENTP